MKIKNNSELNLSHSYFDKNNKMEIYYLEKGQTLEVPDAVAKLWLQYPDIEEVVTKEDLEKALASQTVAKTAVKTKTTTRRKKASK